MTNDLTHMYPASLMNIIQLLLSTIDAYDGLTSQMNFEHLFKGSDVITGFPAYTVGLSIPGLLDVKSV